MLKGLFAGAFSTILFLASPQALADSDNGHTIGKRYSTGINLHQRYPGDAAFRQGTVSYQGPDKGAYVERCYWTARSSFFGIPTGFVQTCKRYTLKNTN